MANFKLNASGIEKLQKAMESYAGNVEESINEILHGEGGTLIHDSVQRLIPASGRKPWNGKVPAANKSKALQNINSNLSVTTTTKKKYQYLYFPDDGTNTKRHAGNQQFFLRGGEAVQDEIVDRCVSRLVNDFEIK